jgi:phosphatidylglycerophosphate synthase
VKLGESIRDAVVVGGPDDASRTVAGVPLLLRTLLVLQRAGVERCTIVGAPPPADPRIRVAMTTATAVAPAGDDALRLVIGPGAVIDAALVYGLTARARAGEVLDVECCGAHVRVAPGSLIAGNGRPSQPPPAGTLAPASTPAAHLERALLRHLENPRDGYLDRALHRRFSRPLTRLLLRTPLSPNAVTVIGILVGVTGGMLVGAASGPATLSGVLLLVLSGVLDCSDGELARLRFTESTLGHWLDVTGDTLVHVALLGGIAARLAATGGVPSWPVLATLGAGVVGAFVVISWSEHTETRRHAAPGWENRVLDGVLSPLTTRDWYVFPVAFAVAGRLDWLVPAAAVGANVFWVVALGVLLRALARVRVAAV